MLVHAFVLCCYAGTKRPAFAHPPCSELLFDLCATGPVGPGRHVQPETARELLCSTLYGTHVAALSV